jgi:hypothetical protein
LGALFAWVPAQQIERCDQSLDALLPLTLAVK